MSDLDDLARRLQRLDGQGFGGYRAVRGEWRGGAVGYYLDHVQPDPFATPSRFRVRLPHAWHGAPAELWSTPPRRIAFADYLTERFADLLAGIGSRGSGRSGRVLVDSGGAEVLDRSACIVGPEAIELRFRVGLPARGRRILGHEAARLLTRSLPEAVAGLRYRELDEAEVRRHVELVEDHAHLQAQLRERGLIAFVANGAILPRSSGASVDPLEDAVPFRSPPSLQQTFLTLHHGEVEGMGVPEGVTLFVGGGFHGKTTLLSAIAAGVYPHHAGDGREWVVTRSDAVAVRSEDGRSVVGVDLSPFITGLPSGGSTRAFTTSDASGSTSLAAAVVEAIELGAGALLMDEDACATNLLVRDARMQALVESEPIVPLIDHVRSLHRRNGVSTLLALGGSGEYLEVADTVVAMESYRPVDVTERAREVVSALPSSRRPSEPLEVLSRPRRCPLRTSFDARVGRRNKVRSRGVRELTLGETEVDLSAVAQLVDASQVRAIGALLERAGTLMIDDLTLPDLVATLLRELDERGWPALRDSPELAWPRPFELGAAINRLRSLRLDGAA